MFLVCYDIFITKNGGENMDGSSIGRRWNMAFLKWSGFCGNAVCIPTSRGTHF